LLVFKLISAELSRKDVHLEVLMDDNVFPAYSSHKVKTKHYEFNEGKPRSLSCLKAC
jgi:hypothetical protein